MQGFFVSGGIACVYNRDVPDRELRPNARCEAEDSHIKEAGAVGVWTKADSVTVFDDFKYGTR